MENTPEERHAVADLLRELKEEAVDLFREEAALAKAEVSEKANRLIKNAVYCGIGAGVALAGVLVLLIGLSYLLSYIYMNLGVQPAVAGWLGPVTLGIVVALIGWALISKGRRTIANEQMAPQKTLDSLRETKDWAQHKLHNTHEKSAI